MSTIIPLHSRRVRADDLTKLRCEYDAYEAMAKRCEGYSFCHGPKGCGGCEPMAEMACTAGEDRSEGNAIWLGLGIAGAAVLVVLALAYTFADPMLRVARVLFGG